MKYRPERMGQLIRDILSKVIIRELEFDGALVTITDVEIDGKLEHAKAFVSVWPSEKKNQVIDVLTAAQKRLQHLAMKQLTVKYPPQLSFALDDGPEIAARVEKLAMQVEKEVADGE